MSDFDRALPWILKFEGGYINAPNDPGGATMKGVTQATYDAWRSAKGQPHQGVGMISDDEVHDIYEVRYWHAGHCDTLPWPLSLLHFDACVNTGIKQATKLMQRAAGTADDGVWGPATAAAIAAQPITMLAMRLLLIRLRFYDLLVQQQPKLAQFFRGWANRVLRLWDAL